MNSVIRTARTINEATQMAAEELNCRVEDLDIEIIEEPKSGLFGFIGSKDAVIKAVRKEGIEEVVAQPIEPSIEQPTKEPIQPVAEVEKESLKSTTASSQAPEFLKNLIHQMGIEGDVREIGQGELMELEIIGVSDEDTGILIGKRGETLDAIQYIVNLVSNRERDQYQRVVIDINSYRKKREESLEKLAQRMAAKAKKYRRNMRLEPMNAYERRIVHSALQNVSGVTTSSEGEEPYRKVVIHVNRK